MKAGDMVQEGQAICTIDTRQVDNARLSLQAAEMGRNDAQRNLQRQKALFAAGDIASAAYEQAQTQAKNAQIQYETAKLNYDNQVEYSNITASIAGKVEICDIEVHDNVAGQNRGGKQGCVLFRAGEDCRPDAGGKPCPYREKRQ